MQDDVRCGVHGGANPRRGENHKKPTRKELHAISRLIATHAQVRAEIRFVTRQIEEGSQQASEVRRVLKRSREAVEQAEGRLTRLTTETTKQAVSRMEERLGRQAEQLRELHARLLFIEGLLGGLEVDERAVIHARLIEGRLWPHVAYDTHISQRQCMRILRAGLEKIYGALAGAWDIDA